MNEAWWKAAGIRALKTICQTAVASASVVAGLISLLMSLGGLPELEETNDVD